jgi:hypothetical protein
MTGTIFQQIITILTVPPGNLVYHLVLAFSIAGTLPGAFNLWQRGGLEAGRRMVIGLALLLLGQLILVLVAGLAQIFPSIENWLPVLDRAVSAFSLVVLIWLWVFPQPLRSADNAMLLLSSLILLMIVITGIWWLIQPSTTSFNGSPPDLLWAGLSLVLSFAGGLLLFIRRQPGYGIGISMFFLLFLGHFVYFFNPLPEGNFPGFVRLTQIAAFPLLLTLPSRFSLGEDLTSNEKFGINPEVFKQFTRLANAQKPDQLFQISTVLVSHALIADIVLLISPPDAKQYINLQCGYILKNQELIDPMIFNSHLVPVLAESLRQRRPLHLPANGNIPDFEGLTKVLNLSLSGSLLSEPIFNPSGESDKALVLLSLDSNRSWTAADRNYLTEIAESLGSIFENKSQSQIFKGKFSELNNSLGNLRTENEHLRNQLANLTSHDQNTTKKLLRVQSDLDLAIQEINMLKRKSSADQAKEGSPK